MIRRYFIALLLAAASSIAIADPLPDWAARVIDGQPPRIAVQAPKSPRFAHLSWPKAIRAKDGAIVVASVAGTFHGDGGGGSPSVSISTDEGKTYSAPKILQEFGPGKEYTQCGNLALGLADDGALVLLAMAYDGNKSNHIFGWRSQDNGREWSVVDTSALGPNKTGSVFGRIINVPGLGLATVGHYRTPSSPTSGIWISGSADGGKSWTQTPRQITDFDGVEPVLLKSGSRLLVFIRAKNRGPQAVAISDDNAKTWKTQVTEIAASEKHVLASPFAVENPEKPGEILVISTERASFPLNSQLVLWRGDAAKLEFKRERTLIEFPAIEGNKNIDLGYPWLLHLEGRRWLLFYYHGLGRGTNHIWSAEVQL